MSSHKIERTSVDRLIMPQDNVKNPLNTLDGVRIENKIKVTKSHQNIVEKEIE